MFRRLTDFEKTWDYERAATIKRLRVLTDASLATAARLGERSPAD